MSLESVIRVFNESVELAQNSTNIKTRLSRCDTAKKQVAVLVAYYVRGLNTPDPNLCHDSIQKLRAAVVADHILKVFADARAKAAVASTAKTKSNVLRQAVLKIRDVLQVANLASVTPVETVIRFLLLEAHEMEIKEILTAADKAAFKGQAAKAKERYEEALFTLRNDNIDDTAQAPAIVWLEDRIRLLCHSPGQSIQTKGISHAGQPCPPVYSAFPARIPNRDELAEALYNANLRPPPQASDLRLPPMNAQGKADASENMRAGCCGCLVLLIIAALIRLILL